jgi:hypothetical protein
MVNDHGQEGVLVQSVNHALAPQHLLYFLPEPQGQGALRPIFSPRCTVCTATASPPEN